MTLQLPTGNAICYSGYRDGQSPDLRRYPSLAQIREDLQLLAPHWPLLRLYDCSPHAERVLQVIREDHLPLRVLPPWVDSRKLVPRLLLPTTPPLRRMKGRRSTSGITPRWISQWLVSW